MRIIGLFLIILHFSCLAQGGKNTSIAFGYQFGKVESFPSVQLNGNFWKEVTFESSVGIGLRTTVFQGRFFPQFSVGLGYNVLHAISKKIQLSPMVMTRVSGYRLSPQTRLNYTEGLVGYSFCYGNRVRLVQSSFFGRGGEWNQHNDLLASFWTFSVNLGIGYVF